MPEAMLTLSEVAERLGLGPTGVQQLLREHKLLGVKDAQGEIVVPADALDGDLPVKHLSGVLTLLHDAGYTHEQSFVWLTTVDETLPGTPLQALQENRATEVKRRAQALAF